MCLKSVSACACFAVCYLTIPTAVNAEYLAGFIWDRSNEFDQGTTPGSTVGNPNTDSEGNSVWQMEYTRAAGDGLGGSNPWYQGQVDLMVWDDDWFNRGGVWAAGDNLNPCISDIACTHNLLDGNFSRIPVVRWINPVEQCFCMTIDGPLTISWEGISGQADNIDAEVVIAHVDASLSTINVIYSRVFEKPTDDRTPESVEENIAISSLCIAPGDEVVLSVRGQSVSPSQGGEPHGWLGFYDNLTFEIARASIPGDLNGDCMVDSEDLDIVRENWGKSVPPGDLAMGDPSEDGFVGSRDLDIVRANWGEQCPATVPEPCDMLLLGGGMLLAGRQCGKTKRHLSGP